jgi:hypothetical protein
MISDILTYGLISLIAMTSFFGILLYVDVNISKMTYYVIISIFFPIYIQLIGKDALTTGTLFVFILYIAYITEGVKNGTSFYTKCDLLVYALLIIGLLSTAVAMRNGFLESIQHGPAIRQYVSFVSSLLFFVVLKNHGLTERKYALSNNAFDAHIENLLSLFILLISMQVVFSIIANYFPPFESFLSLFGGHPSDSLIDVPQLDLLGTESRASTKVVTPEQFGEILAFLSPIVVYKVIKHNSHLWILCLIIFILGVLLSITRSGIILFITGVSVTLLYSLKENFRKTFLVICGLFFTSLLIILAFPSIIEPVLIRFNLAKEAYSSSGGVFSTINRDNFPEFMDYVIMHISLFGNSLYRNDFHNLYMTILHQLGIVGSVTFFSILLLPFLKLLIRFFDNDTIKNELLIFSCIVSMLIFLVNEFKYEFNREASYQQMCWGIFAIYYLVATNNKNKEDIDHSVQ